ncbi:MAG: tRNA (adenosine(37)-N6)-dimethylallyltransferase MiaA [Actinomycetota bacterium]
MTTRLLCLVGPTAGGKTRMAVEVALELKGRGHEPEIVSCDSMGVYRGLDIVADKPSMDERRGIPHHLFDVVDATEDFTALRYRELARAAIDDIAARGGTAMLVGGSGLYFRSVIDELEFAPTDAEVRRRLADESPGVLLERIRAVDPAAAKLLDANNPRRIVRAAEILEITGQPPSDFRTSWERREGGPYTTVVAGLTWDRAELLRRAEERVQREIGAGLVEEVRRVGSFSRTARQALGVKEMIPVIDGEETIETATALLVRNTKNFIRRQINWFRADPRVTWFDASELGFEGAKGAIVEMYVEALG